MASRALTSGVTGLLTAGVPSTSLHKQSSDTDSVVIQLSLKVTDRIPVVVHCKCAQITACEVRDNSGFRVKAVELDYVILVPGAPPTGDTDFAVSGLAVSGLAEVPVDAVYPDEADTSLPEKYDPSDEHDTDFGTPDSDGDQRQDEEDLPPEQDKQDLEEHTEPTDLLTIDQIVAKGMKTKVTQPRKRTEKPQKRKRKKYTVMQRRFPEERYEGFLSCQPDGNWMCTACEAVKPSRMAAKLHVQHKHLKLAEQSGVIKKDGGTKKYHTRIEARCEECGHTVKVSGPGMAALKMKTHMYVKHGVDTGEAHQCPHCPRVCKTTLILRSHVDRVHKDPVVVCPMEGCSATLKRMSLNLHLVRKHTEPTESHVCDKCGRSFRWKSSLLNHQRKTGAHVGRDYPCDWPGCTKEFFCQSSLTAHYVTHSKEKKFQCELCGFRASYKIMLVRHTKRCHKDQPQ